MLFLFQNGEIPALTLSCYEASFLSANARGTATLLTAKCPTPGLIVPGRGKGHKDERECQHIYDLALYVIIKLPIVVQFFLKFTIYPEHLSKLG